MAGDIDRLKLDLRRWTLLLGVLQITVGCLVGFIPPSAVQWFRGIVMAHIEFTANGILMIAFAFLVQELHLNSTALKVGHPIIPQVRSQYMKEKDWIERRLNQNRERFDDDAPFESHDVEEADLLPEVAVAGDSDQSETQPENA
jgi:hypothetical protein